MSWNVGAMIVLAWRCVKRGRAALSTRRARSDAQALVYTAVMNWLVKEEPTHYPFEALVRDGRTSWTGVRNPVAQRHLRTMTEGDRVFYYHTGDVKAIVGIATVVSEPYPDPGDTTGKLWAVDIGPAEALPTPVTLASVKADARFAAHPLVRVPRLSVMPVDDNDWAALEAAGGISS